MENQKINFIFTSKTKTRNQEEEIFFFFNQPSKENRLIEKEKMKGWLTYFLTSPVFLGQDTLFRLVNRLITNGLQVIPQYLTGFNLVELPTFNSAKNSLNIFARIKINRL